MRKLRVRGWILTYTLTLMTIAIIAIYTLTTIFGFQLQLFGDIWANQKIALNNTSGLNLYLSSKKEYFNSMEYKNIRISEVEFSPMTLLKIQSVIAADTNTQWAQVGASYSKNAPVIILPKSIYPLKLAGKCSIQGNALVPFGRIEKYTGLVSSNSFKLKEVTTTSNESTLKPPKPSKKVKNSNKIYYENLDDLPIQNSFNDPTAIFFSTNPIIIDKPYSGNIIIESTKSILINITAELNLAIIKAPEINIQEGWKGCGNFITHKQLIIENETIFNYPSSIIIEWKNSQNSKPFTFPEGSQLNGSMLIKGTPNDPTPSVSGSINGNLYSSIPISFSGSISGQLWTSQFSLSTTSSSYTNLIKNAHLNDSFQKKEIPIPIQFKGYKKSFIQWLD